MKEQPIQGLLLDAGFQGRRQNEHCPAEWIEGCRKNQIWIWPGRVKALSRNTIGVWHLKHTVRPRIPKPRPIGSYTHPGGL